MAKKELKELAMRFKKLGVTAKQYTDDKALEQEIKLFTKGTANTGFLKTYILAKGHDTTLTGGDVAAAQKIGEIDIPRDFLVKSAKLLLVEAGTGANEGKLMVIKEDGAAVQTPYEAPAGVTAAGQWMDLEVNTKGSDEADAVSQHVCMDVSTLVKTYISGNGIDINDNVVSIQFDTTNANGLALTVNGLKLNLATASTAGAQSAADKQLQDEMRSDLALMTNAEIGSWFGYDATESATILGSVSSDSITDE